MSLSHRSWIARILTGCLVLPAVLTITGCSEASNPPSAASGPAPATASPTPSPTEDGCARVVSAIGFAEFLLQPKGKEDQQVFDNAVRGRLAYVEGTVVRFGRYLPADLRPLGETLRDEAKRGANAHISQAEQVTALREYRKTADELIAACRSRGSG